MFFNTFGKTVIPSDALKNGVEYSFMNCDTGRIIEVDGNKYFTVSDGKITIGEKEYSILPLKNSRYKLFNTFTYLKDDDANETPIANLVDSAEDTEAIEFCWYATEKDAVEPLRIMLLGDSITYGYSGDNLENQNWGCRPELTQLMGGIASNRFVSVGSLKDVNTTEDQTALMRHEGHGGWMAEDIYREKYQRWEEDRGLVSFMDGWMKKYKPDLVLIQLGTNDCAFASGRDPQHESEWTPEVMQGVEDRWCNLFEILWANNPDLKVITATTPPTTRSECLNEWFIEFNKRVAKNVERWQSMGRCAVFADTNTAIYNADQHRGLCSDKIHLSLAGYHAMAAVYYKWFLELYPNGVGR